MVFKEGSCLFEAQFFLICELDQCHGSTNVLDEVDQTKSHDGAFKDNAFPVQLFNLVLCRISRFIKLFDSSLEPCENQDEKGAHDVNDQQIESIQRCQAIPQPSIGQQLLQLVQLVKTYECHNIHYQKEEEQ